MRLTNLFAAAALMLTASFGVAQAQGLSLDAGTSAVDPLTKLPPAQWIKLATNLINGKSIIGKPEVFMINATGVELNAVICDGKWQLVGPKPYHEGAPQNLPAWRVTIVPTVGFDGYCKSAIIAQSDTGVLYKATLVSVDGSFTNASFITFQNPQ